MGATTESRFSNNVSYSYDHEELFCSPIHAGIDQLLKRHFQRPMQKHTYILFGH